MASGRGDRIFDLKSGKTGAVVLVALGKHHKGLKALGKVADRAKKGESLDILHMNDCIVIGACSRHRKECFDLVIHVLEQMEEKEAMTND